MAVEISFLILVLVFSGKYSQNNPLKQQFYFASFIFWITFAE